MLLHCGFFYCEDEKGMAQKKASYGNESISALKGGRPGTEAARCYFRLGRAGGVRARRF